MSLLVAKPGLLTTVQDLGRVGYQRHGMIVGGAVDAFAMKVANLLVGNDPGAAVLEMALIGPDLAFDRPALVALCGAEFDFRINGEPAPRDRPVRVGAGETVTFGQANAGARAWLAVGGGIDVPVVLGSRSTYVRGRLGGHEGRPVIAGDRLPLGPEGTTGKERRLRLERGGRRCPTWSVKPETLGGLRPTGRIRAVRGPEWEYFTLASRERLFHESYWVTKDVDRMGMKLAGAGLELAEPREEISSAVNVGTVQVPPSGQPIVLLVGRQSVGGYPRIAVVASVDLGGLAQLKSGDSFRFEEITLVRAHELLRARERDLERVRDGLDRLPL